MWRARELKGSPMEMGKVDQNMFVRQAEMENKALFPSYCHIFYCVVDAFIL